MRDHVDRREKREKRKREKNFILMLKSRKDKITAASVYDDTVHHAPPCPASSSELGPSIF